MSVMKQPRSAGMRLAVEPLEPRETPATLVTTDESRAAALPGDALVLGASVDGRYFIFQSNAKTVLEDQRDEDNTPDVFWVDGLTGTTRLVSAYAGNNGLKAAGVVASVAGQSANAVISADGQSVAFVSRRNAALLNPSLAPIDAGDSSADVFLWNAQYTSDSLDQALAPFEVALVSLQGDGTSAYGNRAEATNPAISSDGKVVAFVSRLNANLSSESKAEDNGDVTPDLFRAVVEDFSATGGITVREADPVTIFTNTTLSKNPQVFGKYAGNLGVDPFGRYMSGDGQTFAVTSDLRSKTLDNQSTLPPDGTLDVYAFRYSAQADDVPANILLMTSIPGQPGQSGGGRAFNAIVPLTNPSVVAFTASILPAGNGYVNRFVNNGFADVYVRSFSGANLGAAVLATAAYDPANKIWSSTTGGNAPLDVSPGSFSINSTGTKIAFTSAATNLIPPTSQGGVSDTNSAFDIFARDLPAGTTTVASVASGGRSTGNLGSTNPRITDDGRLVAFESLATNLVSLPDTNQGTDVFLRNLTNGRTGLASATGNGLATGNAPSFGPVIGANGLNGQLYFSSRATDLDPQYEVAAGSQQGYAVVTPFSTPDRAVGAAVSGGRSGFAAIMTATNDGFLTTSAPVTPFSGFTGEVRVALADVNGDGVADIIAGAGPGGGPRVKVIDGATGKTVYDFFVFEPSFTGGVYVAGGDFNGDGFADIVVGAGEGGGPRVVIINGATRATLADGFVYEPSFRGGVRVSAGDVNGDGLADLVTGAGQGGGPRLSIFSGADLSYRTVLANFFVFEQSLRDGIYVGAGDVNGDLLADVAVGAGPGGAPRVSVFTSQQLLRPVLDSPFNGPTSSTDRLLDFYAFPDSTRDGVRVAIRNVTGSDRATLVAGVGGGGPLVRTFNPQVLSGYLTPQQEAQAFLFEDTGGLSGAWVG